MWGLVAIIIKSYLKKKHFKFLKYDIKFYFKVRFCYTFKCPQVRHILKSLVGLLL